MRPEIIDADRRQEVVRAAKRWRAAGVIGDDALRAIRERYADDRVRPRMAFRVLFFVLGWIAMQSALGMLSLMLVPIVAAVGDATIAWITLSALSAVALAFVTEHLVVTRRLRAAGAEEATAYGVLTGVAGAVGGTLAVLLKAGDRPTVMLTGLALAIAAIAAALRWGIALLGGVCAVALFVAAAAAPYGRAAMIVIAASLVFGLGRIRGQDEIHPAGRRALAEAYTVSVVALYLGVYIVGWESALEEDWLRIFSSRVATSIAKPLEEAPIVAWIAMSALALVLAWRGFRMRDRLRLDLGLLLAAATFVTFRVRQGNAGDWRLFALDGAVLLTAALVLRRVLDRRPERSWNGWTGDALFDDEERRMVLASAAAIAALTPDARVLEAPGRGPGGGDFGGGGASAKF